MTETELTPHQLQVLQQLEKQSEIKLAASEQTEQHADLNALLAIGMVARETDGTHNVFKIAEKGRQVLQSHMQQAASDTVRAGVTKIILLPHLRARLKQLLAGPKTIATGQDYDRDAVREFRELTKLNYVTESEASPDDNTLVFTMTAQGRSAVEE
ncbi:MAG: hypothetical protein AAF653_14130 [Chloroflexota bacterium]